MGKSRNKTPDDIRRNTNAYDRDIIMKEWMLKQADYYYTHLPVTYYEAMEMAVAQWEIRQSQLS